MLSKVASSTTFWVFGMTRPGIEPRSPGPLANTNMYVFNDFLINFEKPKINRDIFITAERFILENKACFGLSSYWIIIVHSWNLCWMSFAKYLNCRPVGWGCRIHRLYLCREVRPLHLTSVLDMALKLTVRFQ